MRQVYWLCLFALAGSGCSLVVDAGEAPATSPTGGEPSGPQDMGEEAAWAPGEPSPTLSSRGGSPRKDYVDEHGRAWGDVKEADDDEDLIEEITCNAGWCILSLDYEIQLK